MSRSHSNRHNRRYVFNGRIKIDIGSFHSIASFQHRSVELNQIITFMQVEHEKVSLTELLQVNDGDTWLGLHYQGVLFPNISTHKYLVSWENNNLASTNTITQKENKKKQFLQKGFRNCKLIFSTLFGKWF